MIFRELIDSITEPFFKGERGNSLFFSIPGQLMGTIATFLPSGMKIIDVSNDLTPIKPFLKILSDCKPEKHVVEENTYKLQTETFLSYFEKGITDYRYDQIRKEEIFFEKQCVQKSIIKLLEIYAKDSYLILNAQHLPDQSIEVIQNLLKSHQNAKFIFCFNGSLIEESSTRIIDFYQQASGYENFFEFRDVEPELLVQTIETPAKIPDYETVLSFVSNCRNFLALNQALTFLKTLEEKQDIYKFSKKQIRRISIEAAALNYYAGVPDYSISFLNFVLEEKLFDEIELRALYLYCLIYFDRNAVSSVKKYSGMIKQRLANDKKNPFYALASAIEYNVTQQSEDFNSVEHYENVLKLLKDQNLINTYTNTLLVMPWSALNDYDSPYDPLPYIDKAIETSEKIGNLFILSTAYHWKAIMLLHIGEQDKAHYWYNKCNDLRTRINELPSIIKVRNGLSYEYLTCAKFKESYELLNDFIYRITEINDYGEIIISISNVAYALFYSRNFDMAYEIFQKIIHLLNIFNMKTERSNTFVPEYNDILAYKTYIDISNNYINRAKLNYHEIIRNKRTPNPINLPIQQLIKAYILIEEGKSAEAIKIMDECNQLFTKFSITEAYRHVFVLYEFAFTLYKHEYYREAELYFQKGMAIAKDRKLKYFYEGITTIEDYFSKIQPFEPLRLNLSDIDAKIEKENLIFQMNKRLRDSQFLNRVMSFNTDSIDLTEYSEEISLAIQDYLLPESIYISEKKGSEWKLISSISTTEKLPPDQNLWNKFYIESAEKDANNLLTFKSEHNCYYANFSKYDFNGALILELKEGNTLSSEVCGILNIAISNIQAQFIMRNQNEHLLFISSTDQLSLLKNRHALQEQISIESDHLKRRSKKKEQKSQTSISFIDLDNFKIINDTFGHEAGDLIIMRFASLLKKIYRRVDFISRFGGDEFVIMLPDTDCQEAKLAADRLRKALTEAEYFIPDLKRHLGKEVFFNDNQKLGFSMGICSNFDMEDISDLEGTMTNADRALYYSKENGKNTVTLWRDIMDNYRM